MSANNIGKEKFEEGMADFVSHNYGAVYFSRANLHNKMGHPDLATEDIQRVTHSSEVNI